MRRYKYGLATALAVIAALALALPVMAAYYSTISVTESNGTSYDMLPVLASMDIDYLADNHFIEGDGRDVRVKTAGGADVPFMLVDDKILFASKINESITNQFRFSTGNSLISDYAIVVGDGGHVTTVDHANLEPADDFEIEFDGYIDTSTVSSSTAPTVAATQKSKETSKVTTHTVDLPASISAGDLLLMFVASNEHLVGTNTITWPPGWTQLFYEEGTDKTVGVAYKIAAGTEGSTVDFTTDVSACSSHITYRVTGFYGTPEYQYNTFSTDNPPDPPSLSPSWNSYNNLWIAGYSGKSDYYPSAYPTNYNGGDYERETTEYSNVACAWRKLEVATEDPDTFTMAGSGSHNVATWTIAVRGTPDGDVYKAGAFTIFKSAVGSYSALIPNYNKIVTATVTSGEYTVIVGADSTNLYIKIDGDTKDTTALSGVSITDNANDWIVELPNCDYFKLTTSDTLRLTYDPDDIIIGTTLPNELAAGTYDGTITYGSNPAGIAVELSGLETKAVSYPTDPVETTDIIQPTTADLFDVNLERLQANPLQPIVAIIASGINLTERLVWLALAFIGLFILLVFILDKSEGQLSFTFFGGAGYCLIMYLLGIYPLWIIVVFAIAGIASLVYERVIAL